MQMEVNLRSIQCLLWIIREGIVSGLFAIHIGIQRRIRTHIPDPTISATIGKQCEIQECVVVRNHRHIVVEELYTWRGSEPSKVCDFIGEVSHGR